MNTATRIKALIRNISKEKKVNAQRLLRNYMFERLLERISLSKYSRNFILKGGMLIAAMVGIDSRTTMDMDATVKGIPLSEQSIKDMFVEIMSVDIDDNVVMLFAGIEDIRDEADYAGYRISINTNFDGIKQILKIDITTGDSITPHEIQYKFGLMFEKRVIGVWAYNLETILAEKFETIIFRSITNTRMRDFYDIYILTKLQANNIDQETLKNALIETANKRGTLMLMDEKEQIISEIAQSSVMEDLWKRYQKKYDYACDISWEEIAEVVGSIFGGSN